MKQYLENVVKSALSTLNYPQLPLSIVSTQDPSHGDYATSISFSLAKELKKSPKEIADTICAQLGKDGLFEKVEVAGNGFINLTLSSQMLFDAIKTKPSASSAGRKVMVEFTDPNPFKEFHIGHLYSNIVGESIARLIESTGAEVRRVTYQGDVGLHVAKSIYGMREKMQAENLNLETIGQKTLVDRVRFLGQSYALGATAYEEDELAKQEVIGLNKKIYSKDPEIIEIYTTGRQWSLEYFEAIYSRLGSKFWKNYFESDAGPIGVELVKEFINKGIFRESQGAIIFPGEDYGLHTRVFINSLGLPTYEAKELGLAVTKYKEFVFDQSIMVTGNEINEYFKVLLKALSLIEPDVALKMKHLSHGMVRLPEGKMSSRTGNVVTGEWLLDEAVKRAGEKMRENKEKFVEDTSGEIAEIVGVGAVKWALLKGSIGKDIEFSFDDSISFEGNSGPYIQYTFVRTQSLLHKAGMSNEKSQISNDTFDWNFDTGKMTFEIEERDLLVALTRYNDIISEAAEKFVPHTVTTYLFELAQSFNNFYQKYPILKGEDSVRDFRLALTAKVGETIKNGLYLLGIKTPDRM
ncbi:MAG: arginine--tRNA ligase [Candidatus Levybacteria bacterium]|nr:arginine--tRNA ligase [Candidatus Levybacteria bacterium]